MEIAEKVLNIAQVIYTQCEHVKYCQSQCKRLRDRIQTLMRPIKILKAQTPQQISPPVEKTLKGLLKTLEKAQELVTKYSQKTWLQKFFQASDIKEEFMQVNVCLGDAAQGLSLLLQAEQQQAFLKVFQQDTCNKEDDKDIKADKAFLEELLASSKETRDAVDDVHNSVKNVDGKVEELTQMVKMFVEESSMKKDNAGPEIAEIVIENLIKTPWTLLMETRSHVIYKGEYHKCPVAIKVFQNPVITCAITVRDIFKKEIETMKIFEHPNILRMYGICIDERESRPHFSIVMEYCRYGTLRDVLTKNPELSWDDRIQMALDVARGVYRLHHTEVKPRLHGCISSTKFFVAEGYRVKICLSCFSLGIVLWEIATGKIPFEGKTKKVHSQYYFRYPTHFVNALAPGLGLFY
ncbi:PREDICTED: mixed lineage kinase domain-like protein isoform X2 [Gavialis gangeticus]|uniref:mixed lineage kinase domain-like protein isoform X2 n=1 Tax=Gavialis gangeticus TaxID=94835 RepID=UPI00092FA9B6|nr:PREDICTED: mixed lineage kinase domain-like protein isoform X2 [Gavialis gangeticus]